jgi:hypothetical protein
MSSLRDYPIELDVSSVVSTKENIIMDGVITRRAPIDTGDRFARRRRCGVWAILICMGLR